MHLIKNAKIYEISLVMYPANPYCRIISVNGVPFGMEIKGER